MTGPGSNGFGPDLAGVLDDPLAHPAPNGSTPSSTARAPSGVEKLSRLVEELTSSGELELFHDRDKVAYASVRVAPSGSAGVDTYPLNASGFGKWLRNRARDRFTGGVVSRDLLAGIIDSLESRAIHDEEERPVSIRVASHEGAVYLDLGDDRRSVVEVRADGWRVLEGTPPVRFIRPKGMGPLPLPEPGGSLDPLLDLVHIEPDDRPLVVAWLLSAFREEGAQPVLVLHGEQGSGKSTGAKVLRSLVDPCKLPVRAAPRSERDLIVAARGSRVLAFDNLSGVEPWFSDALCRLADGTGWGTRALYSDDDETVFSEPRTILLNGIDAAPGRADLLDRAFLVELPRLEDGAGKAEREVLCEADRLRPGALGRLLDAVAAGLRNEHPFEGRADVRNRELLEFIAPAERVLGLDPGTFARALQAARGAAARATIDASDLAQAVTKLPLPWTGSTTELLEAINKVAPGSKLPANATSLGRQLTRYIPALRASGIEVDRPGKRQGQRVWRFSAPARP